MLLQKVKVEYKIERGVPVIIIFARNVKGERVTVRVNGFRPYFYIPQEEVSLIEKEPAIINIDNGSYTTGADGIPLLSKVTVMIPSDVRDITDRYHEKARFFENNILFPTRFLIDSGLMVWFEVLSINVTFDEIKIVKNRDMDLGLLRVGIIDIEISSEKTDLNKIDADDDPISCLSYYDSMQDKIFFYGWKKGMDLRQVQRKIKYKSGSVVSVEKFFPNEKMMFTSFLADWARCRFDVLSGFNVQFDILYLIERGRVLGIPVGKMSEVGYVKIEQRGGSAKARIHGMNVFDSMRAYKLFTSREKSLEHYDLNTVAQHELGDGKVDLGGLKASQLQSKNFELLSKYNKKDTLLVKWILEKKKLLNTYGNYAGIYGVDLESTIEPAQMVSKYMLSVAKDLNRVMMGRSVITESGDGEAMGGEVFEPVGGLSEWVFVHDNKATYPMQIILFNISPETKSQHGDIVTPCGIKFKSKPDGVVKVAMERIVAERNKVKKLRNETKDEEVKKLLKLTDYNVKTMSNSFAGNLRHLDNDLFNAITSGGRFWMEQMRGYIENTGKFKVIYGDTDSCMSKWMTNDGNLKDAERELLKLRDGINVFYGEFAKKEFGLDNNPLRVEAEKIYRTFLQTSAKSGRGAKKKYAGWLLWDDGNAVDEIVIKGFEAVRRDYPVLAKQIQKEILEMFLRMKANSEIRDRIDYYINYIDGLIEKRDFASIGVPVIVNQELSAYNDYKHRAIEWSRDNLKMAVGIGDRPKIVPVVVSSGLPSVPPKYKQESYWIGFNSSEDIPKRVDIDMKAVIKHVVYNPLQSLFETAGMDLTDIIEGRKLRSLEEF